SMVGSLLIALTLASPANVATRPFTAFFGTWTSSADGSPAMTMTWEDRGDGIVYVSTTDAAGVPQESFAFRQDGKDYPYSVRGGGLVSTIAAAPVDERTIEVSYKMAGEGVTSHGRWTVSPDGELLTTRRPNGTSLRLELKTASKPLAASHL